MGMLISGKAKRNDEKAGTDWLKMAADAGGYFEAAIGDPDEHDRTVLLVRFVPGVQAKKTKYVVKRSTR
jgi:hypothetical protein